MFYVQYEYMHAACEVHAYIPNPISNSFPILPGSHVPVILVCLSHELKMRDQKICLTK